MSSASTKSFAKHRKHGAIYPSRVSSTIPAHVYEAEPRNEIFVTFRKDSCNHILDDIFAASTFCRSHVAPWISCIGTCSNGARAFGEKALLSGLPGHFRCPTHDHLETPTHSTGPRLPSKCGPHT